MPTPLYDKFHEFQDATRWCTPSIHPELAQVDNIYGNDMSISYHDLGSPNSDSGVFGLATELAADAYQADHTLFGVNGTTGSNFVVIRGLQEQMKGELHILSSRNVHMSIITAADDYGARLDFIPPVFDDDLHVFLPNEAAQIINAMHETEPNVLLLSNPTYEGASADLTEVVGEVREAFPDTVIYVDEAWGAHFTFSNQLPVSAMQAEADICTQSTHKQGNALQQTSMIHWRDGRIDELALRRSYRSLSTTSPSFHLLAGMDATREFMQTRGAVELQKLIEFSEDFSILIRGIGDCAVHSFSDPTKLLLHFKDRSAADVGHALEARGIISEKSEGHNLLLVAGFQNTWEDAVETAQAIHEVSRDLPVTVSDMPPFPQIIEKGDITSQSILVPLEEAVGRTCVEHIIPYPPGIPALTRGERVTEQHVAYLEAASRNSQMEVMTSRPGHLLIAG